MFNKLNALKLSEAVGYHRTTIYAWLKAGLPRNPDKSFSLPDVIKWLLNREHELLEQDAADAGGNCSSPALEEWRQERVKMAKIERRKLEGSVIETDEVHRAWALRVAEVTAGLEYLSDRLPPMLLGKKREEMQLIIADAVWRLRDAYARNGKYCEAKNK